MHRIVDLCETAGVCDCACVRDSHMLQSCRALGMVSVRVRACV